VENSVEKGGAISVSNSAQEGSALCTDLIAGTFVVLHSENLPPGYSES
jgi:hypothetical protein